MSATATAKTELATLEPLVVDAEQAVEDGSDTEQNAKGTAKRAALLSQLGLTPLAVDAEGAAAMLGLSRAMFYKQADAGRIGPMPVRFGKSVRYSLHELRAWAAAGMPPRHEWITMKSRDGA